MQSPGEDINNLPQEPSTSTPAQTGHGMSMTDTSSVDALESSSPLTFTGFAYILAPVQETQENHSITELDNYSTPTEQPSPVVRPVSLTFSDSSSLSLGSDDDVIAFQGRGTFSRPIEKFFDFKPLKGRHRGKTISSLEELRQRKAPAESIFGRNSPESKDDSVLLPRPERAVSSSNYNAPTESTFGPPIVTKAVKDNSVLPALLVDHHEADGVTSSSDVKAPTESISGRPSVESASQDDPVPVSDTQSPQNPNSIWSWGGVMAPGVASMGSSPVTSPTGGKVHHRRTNAISFPGQNAPAPMPAAAHQALVMLNFNPPVPTPAAGQQPLTIPNPTQQALNMPNPNPPAPMPTPTDDEDEQEDDAEGTVADTTNPEAFGSLFDTQNPVIGTQAHGTESHDGNVIQATTMTPSGSLLPELETPSGSLNDVDGTTPIATESALQRDFSCLSVASTAVALGANATESFSRSQTPSTMGVGTPASTHATDRPDSMDNRATVVASTPTRMRSMTPTVESEMTSHPTYNVQPSLPTQQQMLGPLIDIPEPETSQTAGQLIDDPMASTSVAPATTVDRGWDPDAGVTPWVSRSKPGIGWSYPRKKRANPQRRSVLSQEEEEAVRREFWEQQASAQSEPRALRQRTAARPQPATEQEASRNQQAPSEQQQTSLLITFEDENDGENLAQQETTAVTPSTETDLKELDDPDDNKSQPVSSTGAVVDEPMNHVHLNGDEDSDTEDEDSEADDEAVPDNLSTVTHRTGVTPRYMFGLDGAFDDEESVEVQSEVTVTHRSTIPNRYCFGLDGGSDDVGVMAVESANANIKDEEISEVGSPMDLETDESSADLDDDVVRQYADKYHTKSFYHEGYGGFDVTDRNRSSLQNDIEAKIKVESDDENGQLAKIKVEPDSGNEQPFNEQRVNDRSKKKLRREMRNQLRQQGQLGKKSRRGKDKTIPRTADMSFPAFKYKIRRFLESRHKSLILLALSQAQREAGAMVAKRLNLKCVMHGRHQGVTGMGIFKSKHHVAVKLEEVDIEEIFAEVEPLWRVKQESESGEEGKDIHVKRSVGGKRGKQKLWKVKQESDSGDEGKFIGVEKFTGGQGKKNMHKKGKKPGPPYREGELVAFDAIGTDNRGYGIMLRMGWQPGTSIGTKTDGPLEPIPVKFKNSKRGL